MIRTLSAFAGLAVAASSASAAFIGIELREDKNYAATNPATGLAGFPATNPRVFNLYAKFDGQGAVDTVVSVGQPSTEVTFGINLSLNAGANFYQSPGAAGGTTTNGVNISGAGDNRRFWNTYFSIGVKQFDGDYGATPPTSGIPNIDNTSADPDFGLSNSDGIGTPALQANDTISGGWFNASPPSLQGAARVGPNGFEVFLAQLSIKDLAPGARVWAGGGDAPAAATTWFTDILTGSLQIFRQGGAGEPSAVEHTVMFAVPTPGAIAMFGVAGLVGLRRRR